LRAFARQHDELVELSENRARCLEEGILGDIFRHSAAGAREAWREMEGRKGWLLLGLFSVKSRFRLDGGKNKARRAGRSEPPCSGAPDGPNGADEGAPVRAYL